MAWLWRIIAVYCACPRMLRGRRIWRAWSGGAHNLRRSDLEFRRRAALGVRDDGSRSKCRETYRVFCLERGARPTRVARGADDGGVSSRERNERFLWRQRRSDNPNCRLCNELCARHSAYARCRATSLVPAASTEANRGGVLLSSPCRLRNGVTRVRVFISIPATTSFRRLTHATAK